MFLMIALSSLTYCLMILFVNLMFWMFFFQPIGCNHDQTEYIKIEHLFIGFPLIFLLLTVCGVGEVLPDYIYSFSGGNGKNQKITNNRNIIK